MSEGLTYRGERPQDVPSLDGDDEKPTTSTGVYHGVLDFVDLESVRRRLIRPKRPDRQGLGGRTWFGSVTVPVTLE